MSPNDNRKSIKSKIDKSRNISISILAVNSRKIILKRERQWANVFPVGSI